MVQLSAPGGEINAIPKLDISPFCKKYLNMLNDKKVSGGDGNPRRRSNRSLRATGIRGKTRAKNRGRTRKSSVEERDETTTVGKRS